MTTFPNGILPLVVELQLNNVWTDITPDVRVSSDIDIHVGYENEGSSPSPSSCSLTLNNRLGKYSPRNPMGVYYGKVQRNTPIRVGIAYSSSIGLVGTSRGSGTYGGVRGTIQTADSAALSVAGDLDIRYELVRGAGLATDTPLFRKGVSPDASYSLSGSYTTPVLAWTPDGTSASSKTATATTTTPYTKGDRFAIRATLDVDNGAGGWTVTFYTAPSISGPWTQLGAQVTGAGVTSIFNSTSALALSVSAEDNSTSFEPYTTRPTAGVLPQGETTAFYKAEVRNGIAGTVVASPDFTAQTPGTTSFVDAQGNTWGSLSNAAIARPSAYRRFTGAVSEWPTRWDTTGKDAWVNISAGGVSRRLGQGSAPMLSPLRRWLRNPNPNWISSAIVRETLTPQSYWSLEDSSGSTSGQPDVGATGFAFTTIAQSGSRFSRGVLAPWLPSVLSLYLNDNFQAPVSMTGFINAWEVDFAFSGQGNCTSVVYVRCTDAQVWAIGFDGVANTISVTDPGGTTSNFVSNLLDGTPNFLRFRAYQNGADISYQVFVFPMYNSSPYNRYGVKLGTYAAATLLPVTLIAGTQQGDFNSPLTFGHLAALVCPAASLNSDAYQFPAQAASGWRGQGTQERPQQLAYEKGITVRQPISNALGAPFQVLGYGPGNNALGPQATDTFLNLLHETVRTDGGLVFDSRVEQALIFYQLSTLYNESSTSSAWIPPAVTLTISDNELFDAFEPVDDDQRTRNDVTASSRFGGSAEYSKASGAMSTQEPPNGVGLYDGTLSVNTDKDSQLIDTAGWEVHQGTVDEARFPKISVNFASGAIANNATLTAALRALSVGSRLTVDGATAKGVYDNIRQLVIGYDERLSSKKHEIDFICIPASGYDVFCVADSTYGRLGSDTSSTNATLTTTATSMSVKFTDGTGWSNSAAPFDIIVAGERMTVTAISGTTSPQTFTVTRSVNGVVKTHVADEKVTLFQSSALPF